MSRATETCGLAAIRSDTPRARDAGRKARDTRHHVYDGRGPGRQPGPPARAGGALLPTQFALLFLTRQFSQPFFLGLALFAILDFTRSLFLLLRSLEDLLCLRVYVQEG